MKILQIIYSLASGGAERFVVDLSNELSENKHDVYLCTLRDDKEGNNGFYIQYISSKVNYINLDLKVGFRFSNIYFLAKLIKKIDPDVVHCHHNLVNYIFPLTYLFGRKILFFHTIHNDAKKEIKNKLEYNIRKYFYTKKRINAITISSETSKSFVEYYKTKNYYEIFNGRAVPTKSEKFEEVSKFFRNLDNENNHIFLHVGRCAYQKNQEMLINVFNRLNSENKKVILLIIGAGFESPLGKKLKTIASDKIFFLGEKQNVSDYYFNANAFCLSSLHEGMPIALIEAMACGCTPICTPVGGIVDTVKNGITGFLSTDISEDSYYNTIANYLNNTEKITKNYLNMFYTTNFSIKKCAEQHTNIYIKNKDKLF